MNDLANQPAFPVENDSDKQYNYICKGMTYRQWLSGIALQGVLSNSLYMEAVIKTMDPDGSNDHLGDCICKVAIAHADIMIKELEKTSA